MLRQAKNELTLSVKISGKSPLLIKDGREEIAELFKQLKEQDRERYKDLPAMVFQSRLSPRQLSEKIPRNLPSLLDNIFVPGSGIRGAWRSHLEKTLRSLDDEPRVCDPFNGIGDSGEENTSDASKKTRDDAACSRRLANKKDSAPEHPYRDSCPVCRLFGNTAQGSRIAFGEGKVEGGKPTLIDNNAISRQTGAAISPFKSLVLLDAVVTTEIQIRNFELWQAGLLAYLFDDLKAGLVRLGSGKSKGWGRVKAEVTAMKLTYFGLGDKFAEGKLLGVGEMLSKEKAKEDYGMDQATAPPALPAFSPTESSLWRHSVSITEPGVFWDTCKPFFNETVWTGFDVLKKPGA